MKYDYIKNTMYNGLIQYNNYKGLIDFKIKLLNVKGLFDTNKGVIYYIKYTNNWHKVDFIHTFDIKCINNLDKTGDYTSIKIYNIFEEIGKIQEVEE